MNNFLDFINNDVEVKRTLLSSLPSRTKTNIKKFNETIDEFISKYASYKQSVYKYINAKNKALRIDTVAKDTTEYIERINRVLEVRKFYNPYNTYYEKLGFDELVYNISKYYTFNSDFVDRIINEFIDKFAMVGIELKEQDFNYTPYVNKYMKVFLRVRRSEDIQESLSKTFEEIYWVNPDLISHVELNFRQLIKKNSKKFEEYIKNKQKELSQEFNVHNYRDAILLLEKAYEDLEKVEEEDIYDIVRLAINGNFDISQYLETSKFRQSAYQSFISPNIDVNSKEEMDGICATLNKLRCNLKEYSAYLEIEPMVKQFKNDYAKLANDAKPNYDDLKPVNILIKKKETELERLNKKIAKKPNDRALKLEAVGQAKKLYTLYETYDSEYLKAKVLSVLNINMTISEVLDFYFSFDNFKKNTIQKVFNLNSYNQVLEKSDLFDTFVKDPTNIISRGISVFEETNIPRIIANKYKLNNIQISEEDITKENIGGLNNKIALIERINKINNSSTSVEKIWFLTKSKKILDQEAK